jgi:hypothetical protein
MKYTEATVFDRKSGGAEGPAVRPGSRTKVSVLLVLPQTNSQDDEAVGEPEEKQQNPPLRFAPVGMTNSFKDR